MAGQPQGTFVPKVEWKWDAIPSAVYDMIQKTLETGDVKYLETLGLPETISKEKIKRDTHDNTEKERSRSGEIFILNKYLDQVEIACKFATRCQRYEKQLSELEQSLAAEKTTTNELRQKYQMLQLAMKDMITLDQFNQYAQQLDGKLQENSALNCFMADFYRSHIIMISSFLEEEVEKLDDTVCNFDDIGNVVESIRSIQSILANCAATITSALGGNAGSRDAASGAARRTQIERDIDLQNRHIKDMCGNLTHETEPLKGRSLLLRQRVEALKMANTNYLQANPVFNPASSFPPPEKVVKVETRAGSPLKKMDTSCSPPPAPTLTGDSALSHPSPPNTTKKHRRKKTKQ